jgi:hypothetical protein
MQRNRTAWIAVALIGMLALAAAPTALIAQEEGNGDGDGVLAYLLTHPRVLVRQLRLTPDQVTATRRLLQSTQDTIQPLRRDIASLTHQLQEGLALDAPDACALGQLLVDRKGKYEQIEAALTDFDDSFAALLTPAQLERYEALKRRLRAAGRRDG